LKHIEEAKIILKCMGLPPRQCNEISALTLLALANIKQTDPWNKTKPVRLRIHDILLFAAKEYGREYAENTRETVRRQVIHQFEQAGIIDRNPDESDLATNSPRTHYALKDEVVSLIRIHGKRSWEGRLKNFINEKGTLLEIYRKKRKSVLIPVRISSHKQIKLSPGKHNQLQADIIERFAPIFAPGAYLLYLGDTAQKILHLDEKKMSEIGIPVRRHDKLPDVFLYQVEANRIFLIEAVTSHGPISPKRYYELEKMISKVKATSIYVSAFPDFKEFRRHITEIAWETEVWIAEIPDHLIHFNGDRFFP